MRDEIELIEDILYKHKVYDVIVSVDDHKNIVLNDDDNVWIGKEAYDFLFNELFVYNNGKVDLIKDEDFEQLKEYRKKYDNSYNNVLWHSGTAIDIHYMGNCKIFANGIVSCELVAKKDFTNEYGVSFKKGDILVKVNDKNGLGMFKKEMSLYINDDFELEKILSNEHELYSLEIENKNRFKMSYCNDEDGEKEYDDILKSLNLKDAIYESVKIIQKKCEDRVISDKKLRENVYTKMNEEYNSFIEKLKKLPFEKTIEASYEIAIKQEILEHFHPNSEDNLIYQIKVLNKTDNPLEELYKGWMDYDDGICESLGESIYETIEYLLEDQKQKANHRQTPKWKER